MPTTKTSVHDRRAVVVVLGDLARSPRMVNHVRLLVASKFATDVVAYVATPLPADLQRDERIRVHACATAPSMPTACPRILAYAVKAAAMLVALAQSLLRVLLAKSPPIDVVIVQVPPSIPTLLMCLLLRAATRAALVIDWHNFGHTIMAARVAAKHAEAQPEVDRATAFRHALEGHALRSPVVRLARAHDVALGRFADGHMCVTRSLRDELGTPGWFHWTEKSTPLTAIVLDRPSETFVCGEKDEDVPAQLTCMPAKRTSPIAAALRGDADDAADSSDWLAACYSCGDAPFTTADGKSWKGADRGALVVTATSWTVDEDLGMLLDAAERYARHREDPKASLPRIAVVVTGKGELRAAFHATLVRIRQRMPTFGDHVAVRTPFLESYDDYARLVSLADVGISLHVSSSGLDLPMKAVDMLGCGVPVLALGYATLENEMISAGRNGLLFSNAKELMVCLTKIFAGSFPWTTAGKLRYGTSALLPKLRNGAREWAQGSWADEWNANALPLLMSAMKRRRRHVGAID